jgi:hypothetical protein
MSQAMTPVTFSPRNEDPEEAPRPQFQSDDHGASAVQSSGPSTKQEKWHVLVIILVAAAAGCLDFFMIVQGDFRLSSPAFPQFTGSVAFTQASFAYPPRNLSMTYMLSEWDTFPPLANLKVTAVLGIVGQLFLVGVSAAIVVLQIVKIVFKISKWIPGLCCFLVGLNFSIRLANTLQVELGFRDRSFTLLAYFDQTIGFRPEASNSSLVVGAGILNWFILIILFAFAIRTAIGPGCQSRYANCCGCSFGQ